MTRTFDAAGNILTTTDARAVTTTYKYDAINRVNRVKRITYPKDPAVTFTYDGLGSALVQTIPVKALPDVGSLSSITDGVVTTRYSYTDLGRLGRATHSFVPSGLSLGTIYQYGTAAGAIGKITRMHYPSGNIIQYDYDALGRVAAISLISKEGSALVPVVTPLMTAIEYAPFGAAVSWKWGGGTTISYQRWFDLDGRIYWLPLGAARNTGTTATATAAGKTGAMPSEPSPALTRSLSYDDAGRLERITHRGDAGAALFDQTYAYDGLDRLSGFLAAGTSQAYKYDASGNRTGATFGAANHTNTVDPASNRLAAATGPSPAKSYSYDTAGNIIGDGTTRFTYNDAGRMRDATNSGGTTTYQYNGMGQRVSKTGPLVPTGVNYYMYDEEGHLIGEYGARGVPIQETVYLGDQPVATLRPTGYGAVGVYFIYADQNNTPRVITRAADGRIVWRWDSADPFGLQQPNENPSALGFFTYNLRFPGQYYDKETSLHYNYFRDYDPQIGRYIESDPIGLRGGINTYSYALANPIENTDSKGLFVPLVIGGVCAAGGCEGLFAAAAGAAVWWGINNNPKATGSSGVPEQSWPSFPPFDPTNTSGADKETRNQCFATYTAQIEACKMTTSTPRAREACYARAANVYGECIKKGCK